MKTLLHAPFKSHAEKLGSPFPWHTCFCWSLPASGHQRGCPPSEGYLRVLPDVMACCHLYDILNLASRQFPTAHVNRICFINYPNDFLFQVSFFLLLNIILSQLVYTGQHMNIH